MLAVPGADADRVQVAGLLVALESAAVVLLTVTVEPMSCNADRGLGGLLHRDQGLQVSVHIDLLLDRGEFDELLGELGGVERGERVLGRQLGGQELQKSIVVAGNRLRSGRGGG